ncbi:hypothetical protein U1Q18_026643 [Sarracenia purpurea var. burkii]
MAAALRIPASGVIEQAVNALLKWRDVKSKPEKPKLLEPEDFIYLVLTLKKIPPTVRTNAHKIPLPHPLLGDAADSELCLIIDDRPKASKLTSDAVKKKIKAEDIPITKVLKLSKLRSDYKPFEAKRKLCASYDVFFADKSVVPLLPKLLGKEFFKKKKIPVPVDLTHKNWKEQIEKACSSALLYLRTGTCSSVRVGKASMESREIVENVAAAIAGVVELVPKKLAGVRSLHLKLSESLALPIYQVLPDMKLRIEGRKKSGEEAQKEAQKEVKEDEQSDREKGGSKKKGRIHEVRYMDGDSGVFEDELGNKDELKKSASKADREEESFQKKLKKRKGGDGASKVKSKKKGKESQPCQ